jgi:uncharacterized protein (TIGR01777 family)
MPVFSLPASLMMLLLTFTRTTSRAPFCSAFVVPAVKKTKSSRLVANASFLQDLQKNLFSGMASPAKGSANKYFTIGVTGANGLVGTALRDELSRNTPTIAGKPVRIVQLKRGNTVESKDLSEFETSSVVSLQWNPKAETADKVIDPNALAQMDAIVHLSGENVATGLGPLGFLGIRPWTPEKKQEILDSRLDTTKALVSAVNAKSTPTTMLVASGVGVYGYDYNLGDDAVDESMDVTRTKGFLAEMARVWEDVTQSVSKKNRVVNMRFGVVMSKNGGALGKLYPIFFLGGGGIVGSGTQYLSFISARDIARAIVHCLETPSVKGPVNLCAPEPCTNAEFTKALGSVIGRPTLLPLPGFAVSLLFGEMGEEMLLGGVRAKPSKLLQSGFTFLHPTIEKAVQSAVDESI